MLNDHKQVERAQATPQGLPPVSPPRVPVTLERSLGALAMGIICLISFANVLVRYVTNYSFAFTEEYSTFLMVFMTFIGTALAAASNNHIRITVLVNRLPRWGQLLCEAVSILATTALFALVLYYGALLAFDEYSFGETSPGLGYPRWIYTVWVPILSLVIILRVLGYGWRLLAASRRPGSDAGSDAGEAAR